MGELNINGITIETPRMGLNHTERGYLRRGEGVLRSGIKQNIGIHEIVSDQKIDKNTRFDNNALNALINSLRDKSRRDIPTIIQFRISNKIINQNALRFLINAQIGANCSDIVTIPDPTLRSFNQVWINYIENAIRYVTDHFETGRFVNFMPVLSLNQGKRVLLQKVNWLLSRNIDAIGFRMTGSGKKYINSLVEVINAKENDIWIHLSDVKKSWYGISESHIDTLYGIDTIIKRKAYKYGAFFMARQQSSVASRGLMPTPVGIPIPSTQIQQPIIPPIIKNKNIFESSYLGFINPRDIRNNFGINLSCNCPACRNARNINELVRQLTASYGRGILEVHNSFNANREFVNIRNSIDNDEVQIYFNQKRFIQDNLNSIQERFPNMV